MVGGGRDAFIGAVHRQAIALDGQAELVAGALSSTPDKARASGRDLVLADDRNHGDWQALLADELKRPADERIDFVVDRHAQPRALPGGAGLRRGRLPRGLRQAAGAHARAGRCAGRRGDAAAARSSASPTTTPATRWCGRRARWCARASSATIRKVVVEYNQGWLATHARRRAATSRPTGAPTRRAAARPAPSATSARMPRTWSRPSPAWRSKACAPTSSALVPGRALDDDGSLLLRFEGGARGVLIASQINTGLENDLRLRVSGTLGTLEWRQEQPSQLRAPAARRARSASSRAARPGCMRSGAAREPPAGGPSGGLHRGLRQCVRAASSRTSARGSTASAADPLAADYPRVEDGARGVRFIERTVASAASDAEVDVLVG